MLTPGAVLQSRYHVIRLIARGGMGAVYEARDERLSSVVALKETFFAEEEMSKAFRREASLLATLRHPALPKVIDHFSEGEGQFLVMEFIGGDDLGAMLSARAAPFPPADVVNWGLQALAALEYLHAHQPPIIHRDIKPQNLKLTDSGELILLDFGLAKGASTTSPVSRSVQGYTLRYAPLEQIRGEGTDHRSDLYSLAASLYHLMTNLAPPDALARVTALVSSKPDPLVLADELNPHVPPAVARVLNAALAQDRDRRPPKTSVMRAALEAAAGESSTAQTAIIGGNQTAAAGMVAETETARGRPTSLDTSAATLHGKSAAAVQPGPIAGAATQGPKARHALRNLIIICGAVLLLLASAAAAYLLLFRSMSADAVMDGGSASTDVGSPTPLTAKTILCGTSNAEAHYFTFNAKRGALTMTLNVVASGSNVTTELFDAKSQNIRFEDGANHLAVNSNGHNQEGKAKVLIERDQPVQLKINASSPKEVRVYRLKIDGDVELAGGWFGSSDKALEPLTELLADRDDPRRLESKQVISGGTAKDLYLSFTAGPGELRLSLDVFGTGGIVAAELFDPDSKELRFEPDGNLSVSANRHHEQERAVVLLPEKKPLLMRVTNVFPNDTRAFRLTFSGPIDGLAEKSAGDPVSAALQKHFAERDAPSPLTSNEITGRGSEKDLYYSFTGGPGKVKLLLEAEGNGSSVAAELFGNEARRVHFENNQNSVTVHASKDAPASEAAYFDLANEETVVMRLSQIFPDQLRSFHIKLDGAVKLEGASEITEDSPPDASNPDQPPQTEAQPQAPLQVHPQAHPLRRLIRPLRRTRRGGGR